MKFSTDKLPLINLPENKDATAATIKDSTTAGPATLCATIPATRYIPVPTQLPTPREVKSKVVKTFYKGKTQNRNIRIAMNKIV